MGLWLRLTNGVTMTALRFNELSVRERKIVVRKTGDTLRGNTFDHRLFAKRTWTVIISADETFGITSTKRDFLDDYFEAEQREVAFDASLTEPVSGWIAVAIEGGETPAEDLEGSKYLPEYTFILIEKEAS